MEVYAEPHNKVRQCCATCAHCQCPDCSPTRCFALSKPIMQPQFECCKQWELSEEFEGDTK